MEQYISKSTLVAEMDRLMSDVDKHSDMGYPDNDNYYDGRRSTLVLLRSFLDTLEVREVDLEEDVDLEEELHKWKQKHFDGIGHVLDGEGGWIGIKSLFDIAEHFFELGLKAKGE